MTKTRDMEAIRAELRAASDAYLAARDADERESVWRPLSDQVKARSQELAGTIAAGADDCPDCKTAPHGLRHVRATQQGGEVHFYHTVEIGCLGCPKKAVASTPPEPSGPDLEQYAEATRARAVEKWNAGEYLRPKPAEG